MVDAPIKRLAALLFAALALSTFSVVDAREPQPPAPLELKLVGPGFVHEGQKLNFKAVLVNRSSTPIVLAARDSRLDFDLRWTINDSSGRELPQKPLFYCPVGGPGWFQNLTRRLKDSDLMVLKPGAQLELEYDDISEFYLFPGRGRYQVAFSYTYVPPQVGGNNGRTEDLFGQKYDLSDLGSENLDALKQARAVVAQSKAILLFE
jgi:hypothetical protein